MATTFLYNVGSVGAGKSYWRGSRYIVTEFLANDPDAIHWSNFPIKFDPWIDSDGRENRGLIAIAAEYGFDEETIRRRVRLIPDEVLERCKNKDFKKGDTPYFLWNWFEDESISLAKAHVAIDEIQNYINRKHPKQVKFGWEEFLGEGRHTGATFEFITQAPEKVERSIEMHCTHRLRIEKCEDRRDPWAGVTYYDWYQLRYLFTRKYDPCSVEVPQRKVYRGSVARWIEDWSAEKVFSFEPKWFETYDSHAKGSATTLQGSQLEPECKRFGPVRLLVWFFRRNASRIVWNPATQSIYFVAGIFLFLWATQSGFLNISKMFGPPSAAASPSKTENTLEPSMPAVEVKDTAELISVVEGEVEDGTKNRDIQEVSRVLRRPKLTAIVGRDCYFDDGSRIRIGEVGRYGFFEKRKITQIDRRNRLVVVDNDDVFLLGSAAEVGGSDESTDTDDGSKSDSSGLSFGAENSVKRISEFGRR